MHSSPFPTLTEINTQDWQAVRLASYMGNVIFKCPRTGMNVQHWLADEPEPSDPQASYETVTCSACGGLHFINRSNGRLLGQQED